MRTVSEVDVAVLDASPTDDEVGAVAALAQAVQDDDRPDDPPISVAELAGELRHPFPLSRMVNVVARVDGELVGRVTAHVEGRPTNPGHTDLAVVEVHPAFRRRGVATAMLCAVRAELEAAGAASVVAWPHDDAGRALSERCGLTMRQLERESRLLIDDVDRAQLHEWTLAPKARANGYQVVAFPLPVPDHLLEAWVRAKDAMADAPLDEMEWRHEPETADWVRALEALHAERGAVAYGSLALAADGTGVGMSWILLHPDRPRLAHQEDTAVEPAHRGHGLGRWLKAANLLQVLEAVPEVQIVQTYNAESNGPMLDINVAMGFRPSRAYYAHQGPFSSFAAALDES